MRLGTGLAVSSMREGKGREEIVSSWKGRNTNLPTKLPNWEEVGHNIYEMCVLCHKKNQIKHKVAVGHL